MIEFTYRGIEGNFCFSSGFVSYNGSGFRLEDAPVGLQRKIASCFWDRILK